MILCITVQHVHYTEFYLLYLEGIYTPLQYVIHASWCW